MKPTNEPRTSGVFTTRQKPAVARKAFQREAEKILNGWVSRRGIRRKAKDGSQHPDEDPADWMRRCTYRLVRSLIAKKQQEILEDLVAEVGRPHAGPTGINGKPFKQALLVMFWWNPEHTSSPLLDRRRRSELGDALEYAYRHRIPAKHLNAFIKKAGIKRIPAKIRKGLWEPGFEDLRARVVSDPPNPAQTRNENA